MIDVVAAVNDNSILAHNLMRSPMLHRPDVALCVQRDFRSAALAFRSATRKCRGEILVFVHQDVYLPANWPDQLQDSLRRLESSDPNWAVLGIYGVKVNGEQVGCAWSSGLNTMVGQPFEEPAAIESIDEVLIVLRRSSGVEFDPDLPGYHLYGTDLVQTALSRGKGAYAICAPVIHNSRPALYLGSDYFASYRYVARKWRDRLPIHNNVACIVKPGWGYLGMRAHHKINEWRYAHLRRDQLDRRYDCIALARKLGLE